MSDIHARVQETGPASCCELCVWAFWDAREGRGAAPGVLVKDLKTRGVAEACTIVTVCLCIVDGYGDAIVCCALNEHLNSICRASRVHRLVCRSTGQENEAATVVYARMHAARVGDEVL